MDLRSVEQYSAFVASLEPGVPYCAGSRPADAPADVVELGAGLVDPATLFWLLKCLEGYARAQPASAWRHSNLSRAIQYLALTQEGETRLCRWAGRAWLTVRSAARAAVVLEVLAACRRKPGQDLQFDPKVLARVDVWNALLDAPQRARSGAARALVYLLGPHAPSAAVRLPLPLKERVRNLVGPLNQTLPPDGWVLALPAAAVRTAPYRSPVTLHFFHEADLYAAVRNALGLGYAVGERDDALCCATSGCALLLKLCPRGSDWRGLLVDAAAGPPPEQGTWLGPYTWCYYSPKLGTFASASAVRSLLDARGWTGYHETFSERADVGYLVTVVLRAKLFWERFAPLRALPADSSRTVPLPYLRLLSRTAAPEGVDLVLAASECSVQDVPARLGTSRREPLSVRVLYQVLQASGLEVRDLVQDGYVRTAVLPAGLCPVWWRRVEACPGRFWATHVRLWNAHAPKKVPS